MINHPDRHRIGKARLLRRQGKTYAEIEEVIGRVGKDTMKEWLRGIPRPSATRRSRGLPALAKECRRLRSQGLTQGEIRERAGASVGSLSLWFRDGKVPARVEQRRQAHLQELRARGSKVLHEAAVERRDERLVAARESIGNISARDLFIAGIALYWAEGTKDKPWRRTGRVTLINSDPTVLRVFLVWLDLLGIPPEDRTYRLSIHESPDVAAHERWWASQLSLADAPFGRATLKRHNPKPTRHNRQETYHGCLVISVARSVALYDSIDGWWSALAEAAADARAAATS